MLSQVTSYWNYGTQYVGIEVTHIKDSLTFFAVSAQKKKGEFENLTFIQGASFSEITNEIGKNKHAYLVINTDKVLIKEIAPEKDLQKALVKAFPGLSPSDFYFEVTHSKEKSFVAVCRKEEVERLLQEAEKESIEILGFHLGFATITPLLGFLKTQEVNLSRQILTLQEGSILSFSNEIPKKTTYSLESTQVDSLYLLAVSSLFQYLTNPERFSNSEEKNQALRSLHLEKNFFRKGIAIGIIVMLVLLLLNIFYFTSYSKQYQKLQEETELASVQKELLSKKAQEVEKKERVVHNILNSGNSKSSFYLNRIVNSAPHSLVFSEISYHPLLKTVRPDKPIEYNKGTLLIKGESSNKESFSNWVEQLEKMEWLDKVTVSHYGTHTSTLDRFEITLTLAHDTTE